jgi:sugar/nucleoside kinase (ribokinase family)
LDGSAFGAVADLALCLELLEAGCALEGGEAGGRLEALAAARDHGAAAAGRGEGGSCADDAPDQERARSPAPVLPVHASIVPVRVAALGDVMLDVIVRLEEPLARGDDVRAATRAGAGGQAANVAAWAASLGAHGRCIAKRGDDDAGELVARELGRHGVELVGPVAPGTTGVVVSVVEDGERSMASDRGVAPSFRPEELETAWVRDCDVLHLSGYALLREPIDATALLAARLAREAGARVSVDLAAWTEIRRYGPVRFRELLDTVAPDVLFATEAEWELLGLAASPAKAAASPEGAYLTAPVSVLKRGPRGVTVLTEDARLDLAPLQTEVVDTTGAGDALAAGFLLGGPLEEAARRGLEAAASCVAKVGSLP